MSDYRQLIDSERVSTPTREVLAARAQPDDPNYRPRILSPQNLLTLRAILKTVLPQALTDAIDLAARIDADLSLGGSDGWRSALLPPDPQAYRDALDLLENDAYWLAGDTQRASAGLTAPMQAWLEDMCTLAVRLYISHPRTLERLGYSGIANGGDGLPKTGFVAVGIDEREPWEPEAELP